MKKGDTVYVKATLREGKIFPRKAHHVNSAGVYLERWKSSVPYNPEDLIEDFEEARKIAIKAVEAQERRLAKRRVELENLKPRQAVA